MGGGEARRGVVLRALNVRQLVGSLGVVSLGVGALATIAIDIHRQVGDSSEVLNYEDAVGGAILGLPAIVMAIAGVRMLFLTVEFQRSRLVIRQIFSTRRFDRESISTVEYSQGVGLSPSVLEVSMGEQAVQVNLYGRFRRQAEAERLVEQVQNWRRGASPSLTDP